MPARPCLPPTRRASRALCALLLLLSGALCGTAAGNPSPAGGRWTVLPFKYGGVTIDPKGRAWFEDPARSVDDAEMKQSVEAAWAGRTSLVRGIHLMMIDRRGRVWGIRTRAENGVESLLLCYDGKTWSEHHVEDRPNAAQPRRPDGRVERSNVLATFRAAWEGPDGTVFFYDNWGLHYLQPGGYWRFQSLYQHNKGPRETDMGGGPPPRFLAAGGAAYFYRLPDSRPGTRGVLRYDGKSWRLFDERDGLPPDPVTAVLPMPDGSLALVTNHNFRGSWLEPWRPDAANPKDAFPLTAKLDALVAQLGDDDVRRRDAVTDAIVDLGGCVVARINARLASEADPETAGRLRLVLERVNRRPYVQKLQGGPRYSGIWPLVTLRNGDLLMSAGNWEDAGGKPHPDEWLVLRRDGSWSGTPTWKDWSQFLRDPPFEDARGRLWTVERGRGAIRLEAAGTGEAQPDGKAPGPTSGLRPRVISGPDLAELTSVLGQDARGRIYFDAGVDVDGSFGDFYRHLLAVYDESGRDDSVELEGRTWAEAGPSPLVASDGSTWACLDPSWNWTGEGPVPDGPAVYRFRGGSRERMLDLKGQDGQIVRPVRQLAALTDGGMLVLFSKAGDDDANPTPAGFFDGKAWHEAKSLRELVEAHYAALRPRLAPGLPASVPTRSEGPVADGPATDGFGVVADAAGDVWVAEGTGPARYDGKSWHDALPLLRGAPGTSDDDRESIQGPWQLYPLDAGRALAVLGDRGTWVVWREPARNPAGAVAGGAAGETIRARRDSTHLREEDFIFHAHPRVRAGADSLWGVIDPMYFPDAVRVGRAGSQVFDNAGIPLLCDTRGRVWFQQYDALAFGDAAGKSGPAATLKLGLVKPCQMAESPDGRIWLLDQRCLRRIEVSGETSGGGAGGGRGGGGAAGGGGAPTIREAARWDWGTPKGVQFTSCICDAEGGLWVTWGGWVRRVTLPRAERR